MCFMVVAAAWQMAQHGWSIAGILIGLVVLAWLECRRCVGVGPGAVQIDISATGKIQLALRAGKGVPKTMTTMAWAAEQQAEIRLLAHSTIWPSLLMLRFSSADRACIVIPVFKDCLSEAGFRELSVACRWIAAHNH